ncbi:MAG: prepilin-type N-terminal cleavage/methylation domain-containing protein [bacterium]
MKKRGLTLIEIIVSIGIIGIIITTLLIVIYNIHLSQSRTIFGNIVAKKAEFYILKNLVEKEIYVKKEDTTNTISIIKEVIEKSFKKDDSLKEVEIKEITIKFVDFGSSNIEDKKDIKNIKGIKVRKLGTQINQKNIEIEKDYVSINIKYFIKTLKQEEVVEIVIPLIGIEKLLPPPPTGDTPSNNGGSSSSTSSPITQMNTSVAF